MSHRLFWRGNGIIISGVGNTIKDVENNRNDGVAMYGRNNAVANCHIVGNSRYGVRLLEADLASFMTAATRNGGASRQI